MKLSDDAATNMVIGFLGAALVVFFTGVCVVIAVKQTAPTQLWAAGSAITGALVGVLMPSPGDGSASVASAKAADTTHAAGVQAAVTASEQPQQQAESDAANQAVASVRAARSQIQTTNVRITRGQGPSAAAATGAQTARLSVQALADDAQAAVRTAQQTADALNHPVAGRPVDPVAVATANTQGVNAAKSSSSAAMKTVWFLALMFVVFLAIGVALETANSVTQAPLVEAGKTVIALASSAGAALVALFAPQPSKPAAGAKT